MVQWLADNWGTIAYLVGSLLAVFAGAKVGQRHGERKAAADLDGETPTERIRKKVQGGPLVVLPLVFVAALAASAPGCAWMSKRSTYSTLSSQQRQAFKARSAAWATHLEDVHKICLAKAVACGRAGDLDCPDLRSCQAFKSDMATVYGGMLRHLARASDLLDERAEPAVIEEALQAATNSWRSLENRIKEYCDGQNHDGSGAAPAAGDAGATPGG